MSVLTQSEDCRAAWREACESWEHPLPFLHPAFQEGLERIVPWKRHVLVSSGKAVLSGFVRSRGPVRDLVLPPFQPFSTFAPDLDPAHLARQLRECSDLPKDWLLSITPDQANVLQTGSLDRGIKMVERHTFHLPSAPFDEAMASWSSGPRRQVRKSMGSFDFWSSHGTPGDVSPEAKKLDEVIHAAVDLAEQAYGRHGRPLPLPSRGLARWARDLFYAGLARVYGLYDQASGDVAAAIVALHDGSTAWYWLAGSAPGPGMTVLMAHVQDDLHQAGIATLDLMGANTPGIAEFKRRLGGERKTYVHLRSRTFLGSLTDIMAHGLARFLPRRRNTKGSDHLGEGA